MQKVKDKLEEAAKSFGISIKSLNDKIESLDLDIGEFWALKNVLELDEPQVRKLFKM